MEQLIDEYAHRRIYLSAACFAEAVLDTIPDLKANHKATQAHSFCTIRFLADTSYGYAVCTCPHHRTPQASAIEDTPESPCTDQCPPWEHEHEEITDQAACVPGVALASASHSIPR